MSNTVCPKVLDSAAADAAVWMNLTGMAPLASVREVLSRPKHMAARGIDPKLIVERAFKLIEPESHAMLQSAAEQMALALAAGCSNTSAFYTACIVSKLERHIDEFPFCAAKLVKRLAHSVA